ncbi:MAG: GNAT family N-acetyltransferase [Thiotrichaceae bacterium]|nr:GNAT family N-acetyltransferase [Thiotrichaceae bacterium]
MDRLIENTSVNKFNQDQTLEIVMVQESTAMVALESSWNTLYASCQQNPISLSYAWQYTWWMSHAEKIGGTLFISCVYQEDKLLALVPLYLDPKSNVDSLRFIGQSERDQEVPVCVQADILIANLDHSLKSGVMDLLTIHFRTLGKHYNITINCLNEKGLFYSFIKTLPKQCRLNRNARLNLLNINLPESFDGFLQSQNEAWLNSYRKHNIALDELDEEPEYRFYNEPYQMDSGVESFAQLSCSGQRRNTGGHCSFDDDEYMSFHENLSFELALRGQGYIASLIVNRHLLASACYVVVDKKLHIYQLASIKNSRHASFSTSVLLILAIIERAIEEGCESISFLSEWGEDELNGMALEGEIQRLYHLRWFRNRGRIYLENSVRKLYRTLIWR